MKDGGCGCHLKAFIPDLTKIARAWTLQQSKEQNKNIFNFGRPGTAAGTGGLPANVGRALLCQASKRVGGCCRRNHREAVGRSLDIHGHSLPKTNITTRGRRVLLRRLAHEPALFDEQAFSGRHQGMTDHSHQVDFQAAASLYKWPSLGNSRREDRAPYMIVNGTLDQCIRDFMGKPEKTRHLYEIRTTSQPPLVPDVLSPEHVIELSRLREFL
ncbi:hypothetical protein [Bradyrhizobium sp. RD5-C2]|nr:hypothetical protein [Bradyrhizobium sp. RD5-C2]